MDISLHDRLPQGIIVVSLSLRLVARATNGRLKLIAGTKLGLPSVLILRIARRFPSRNPPNKAGTSVSSMPCFVMIHSGLFAHTHHPAIC